MNNVYRCQPKIMALRTAPENESTHRLDHSLTPTLSQREREIKVSLRDFHDNPLCQDIDGCGLGEGILNQEITVEIHSSILVSKHRGLRICLAKIVTWF